VDLLEVVLDVTDDQLLAAIVESPDDDGPRLAYAARLDERGDPRGEFIRIQCAIARGESNLVPRERALVEAHGRAWAGPLAELVDRWEFRRGFVEMVATNRFAAHAARIFEHAPTVRELHGGGGTAIEPFATTPLFSRIRTLVLTGRAVYDRVCEELARSQHARNLRSLELRGVLLSDAGAALLAGADSLHALETLIYCGDALGDLGLVALATSPILSTVAKLVVDSDFTAESAAALATAATTTALRSLAVSGRVAPDDRFAAELAAGGSLRNLRALSLAQWEPGKLGRIGAAGARAIATSSMLTALERLSLARNRIGDDGACALAEGTALRALVDLDVAAAGIGPRGAAALAGGLPSLTSLSIDDNPIGDDGARALAQRAGLTTLSLAGCVVGREAAAALASSPSAAARAALPAVVVRHDPPPGFLAPPRPHTATAARAADGTDDPAEAWRRIVAALPILSTGNRRFRAIRSERCAGCGGSGIGGWDPCYPCGGTGRIETVDHTDHPWTVADCVLFGSDPDGLVRAEALEREMAARLAHWTTVADPPPTWMTTAARPHLHALVPLGYLDLVRALPNVAHLPSVHTGHEGWAENAAALFDAAFPGVPSPFEPLFQLWALGYAIHDDALLAPA
jgi:uncharacterized protein (TIGR02996 family)